MAAPSNWADEDQWELINDDGFVYKRKKRRHFDPTASTSVAPPPDPAADEKNRRKRKKKTLIKLKERYENEIHQWQLLSNTFKALDSKSLNQRKPPDPFESTQLPLDSPTQSSDSACRLLLDDLLAQAEAKEAMFSNIFYFCNVAEALCNAQEEESKQWLLDLPIWASSPRELINSLCDE